MTLASESSSQSAAQPRNRRPFIFSVFLVSVLASLGMVFQSLRYSSGWTSSHSDADTSSFLAPEPPSTVAANVILKSETKAKRRPPPEDAVKTPRFGDAVQKRADKLRTRNDPPGVDKDERTLEESAAPRGTSKVVQSHEPLEMNETQATRTNASPRRRKSSSKKQSEVIAYAITVTECSSTSSSYLDGAAVMAYAIDKHSVRNPKSTSHYDYQLYAFLHPDARNCSDALAAVGYKVLLRPTPINEADIRGPHKEYVNGAGCCGAKEFLKLYSYTLTDHPVVVHFDTDMLLMQPLDVLFDSMLDDPSAPARQHLPAMWSTNATDLPDRIEAYFTRDYNMMVPRSRPTNQTAVQGGFLVVRPNRTQFAQYLEIILEGDYMPGDGWGSSRGLRFGGHYGAPQIQGLCNYFYGHVRQGYSVELNRCRINNMVDDPHVTEKGPYEGECRSMEKECEDCREMNLTDVMLAHYTLCGKPWWCRSDKTGLCREILDEWFFYRHEMEEKWAKEHASYKTTALRRKAPWNGARAEDTFCQGGRYDPIRLPGQNTTR